MSNVLDIKEAERVLETLLDSLVAAGETDEDRLTDVAIDMLAEERPDVLLSIGKAAVEKEVEAALVELGVSFT